MVVVVVCGVVAVADGHRAVELEWRRRRGHERDDFAGRWRPGCWMLDEAGCSKQYIQVKISKLILGKNAVGWLEFEHGNLADDARGDQGARKSSEPTRMRTSHVTMHGAPDLP